MLLDFKRFKMWLMPIWIALLLILLALVYLIFRPENPAYVVLHKELVQDLIQDHSLALKEQKKPYPVSLIFYSRQGAFEQSLQGQKVQGSWFFKGDDLCVQVLKKDYCGRFVMQSHGRLAFMEDGQITHEVQKVVMGNAIAALDQQQKTVVKALPLNPVSK